MNRKKFTQIKGALLLEVMVAACILTTGIVLSLGMYFRSSEKHYRSSVLARVLLLMESETAKLYAMNYHTLSDYSCTYAEEEGIYSCRVTIRTDESLPMKKINVQFTWEVAREKEEWTEEIIRAELRNNYEKV